MFTVLGGLIVSAVSSQDASTTETGPIPAENTNNSDSDAENLAVGGMAPLRTILDQSSAKPYQVGAAGDMIGFSHSDGSGTQTITVIHAGKSWMAVYHIDRSGKIRLVSSRPIDADFSLQLNATAPLPDEIRKMTKP